KKNLITALALSLVIFTACDQYSEKNSTTSALGTASSTNREAEAKVKAEEFIKQSYKTNLLEIDLGKMAQKKANQKNVKDFAGMMVKDHTKSNEELRKIANQKKYSLPDTTSQQFKNEMKEKKTSL